MSASSPNPPSTFQRILRHPVSRVIIGMFMLVTPIAVGQGLIVSLPLSRLWLNVLLGAFTVPVAYWAYRLFVRRVERREMSELGTAGAGRELLWGAAIGALLFGGTALTLALAGSLSISGTNEIGVMIIPFIGAVTSGWFEELLFRGILFRIVENALGSWLALVISAVIFGSLHLINPQATLLGAVAVMLEAGVTLAAAYMVTRRLWLPVGIHFAWNFVQAGIFGIIVSGTTLRPGLLRTSLAGPEWLTGGSFGAEASVAAMALGVIVGAALIVRAVKNGHVIPPPWRP